ncbi:MAG: TonB-dependent receptor [Clostridium sp.]|nr:TonB-dependent receptor [Prevotella sp.]MCM1429382.1 TonB-dependent receptor [Clostridium sp.]MCM1475583.1 TonB-dependent receptor [Muribaculaceae bacterium]
MKRLILLATAATVCSAAAWADIVCSGQVIDENGEPLIGATVSVPGTHIGVAADLDGRFTLRVPDNAKELRFDYVGYNPVTLRPGKNMGVVELKPNSTMLQDVVVTQSMARTRETPIAMSEITALQIEAKLGNKEFPEVLKTTPGVWATPEGGGYGDAKINMRGFKAPNVAVLVNGIPMNDMEWGGIYWSNFAGLGAVTSSMQTQRGLGASIISSPSIGGTINITTRGLDSKKGGSIWYGMGNDGLNDIGFSLSTGLMPNGWAITVLGSRKWGNGYIQGTEFEAWNYFANISKKIGNSHQISLTAFGAPQWHNQRNTYYGTLDILGWQNAKQYMDGESMYKFNANYGFDNEGQRRTSYRNQYHKPIISLNHIWQINERSSLSSALYASLASGGGYSGQGRTSDWRNKWRGAYNGQLLWDFRNPDGTFNYGMIQDVNAASLTGSQMAMAQSINNHQWYGLVSTYKNEVLPNKLTLTGGIDLRYYVGDHRTELIDLYGGKYFMDDTDRANVKPENNSAALNPNWKYQKLGVGDVVYRNYIGHTHQEGIYGQAEYKLLDGAITTVLAGSLNVTGYQKVDKFYYDKAHGKTPWKTFLGGTIKGGANWNIDRHNNVFINGGYISKAPFFSRGVFLNPETSNAINPKSKNEKIGSIEVGYGFHSPVFSLELNGYYTKWMDRCDRDTQKRGEMSNGDYYTLNLENVSAQHMGVELNFTYLPVKWMEINGMISMGNWEWCNNPKGYYYNEQGQPLKNTKGELASSVGAADHAWGVINQKGHKVLGSAQTTGALGVEFKPFKGFRIGADWTFSARNYADYYLDASALSMNSELTLAEPWKIPWGNELDLSCSYKFKLGGLDATIYGNVYNLFNYFYVKDAQTPYSVPGTWSNATYAIYSFGRTFSMRLKINF